MNTTFLAVYVFGDLLNLVTVIISVLALFLILMLLHFFKLFFFKFAVVIVSAKQRNPHTWYKDLGFT